MIKIIVADDHAVVRTGLCRILDAEEDMEVIGEAGDGREAVDLCKKLKPDVVILDYDMPEIDGLEATRQISSLKTDTKILVLTMYDREDFALRFLQAGALGFLPKNITFEELPFAVRKVASGSVYMTASVSEDKGLLPPRKDMLPTEHDKKDLMSLLSDREFQVLVRLARGKKTGEIAEELNIGYNTVKTYRYRIMEKLNLKNAYELAHFAISRGLIEKFE
ncbi:MAG: response regulator transcription factor [bacterium]